MRWSALILLCLLTFVVGLGRAAITDSDEAFYAEAGREMVVSGDWITPHYNFEPRLQKPILFYWLIAATYRIAGISEWAARLWSGLAGVGLALVAAAVFRRWSGRRDGFLAGAIVATSFGVVPLARQSLPDTPLAFFVSVTIWAAIEAVSVISPDGVASRLRRSTWLSIAAAAAGLGMLTKGPVAVVLPVTVLLPLMWWEWRRSRGTYVFPLRARDVTVAALVFLLVATPWYLAVMNAQGIDYARQFFVGENVDRFATATYNSWRGYEYIPVVIAGLFPWSAFLLLWLGPIRAWAKGQLLLDAADARLIAWAAGPLLFFFVSVGSQPRYILPCLVPLCVLLARTISSRLEPTGDRAGRGLFFAAALLSAGTIVLLGALLWRAARTLAVNGVPSMDAGPLVMVAIGVAAVVAVVVTPRRMAAGVLVAAAALSLVAFESKLLAPARPEPVEVIAAAIRSEPKPEELCACGAFARTLVFYTGLQTATREVNADNLQQLEQILGNSERVLAAVDGRALAALEAARGMRFPRLAEVTYLNMHEWQRGEVLVRPDPAWTQQVVLIANR